MAQRLTPEQRLVCQKLVDSFDAYLAGEGADDRSKRLVHGDYRLDNMLFGRPGSLRDPTVAGLADRHLGTRVHRRRLLPGMR